MFNTLAKKLIGTMVLLVTICTVSFGVISYLKLQDSMIDQMKRDGITLVTTLSREVKAYSLDNPEEMQKFFQEVRNQSQGNISYLSITDLKQAIIVSDSSRSDTGSGKKDSGGSGEEVDGATSASQSGDISEAVSGEGISGFIFVSPNGEEVYNVSVPFTSGSDFSGTFNIGISLNGMNEQISSTLYEILITMAIILAATVILGVLIAKTLTRPISDVVKRLYEFEKGNFTVEFKNKSHDEIGKLTLALNRSISVLRGTIGSVKNTGNELNGAAAALAKSGNEVAANGEEISQGIGDVAETIEVQNGNIAGIAERLAIFGHKMDSMLSEVQNVFHGNGLIKDTASLGYTNLMSLVETIDDIREAFNRSIGEITTLHSNTRVINEIAGVINDVAGQTNLLALNAAIESARAGEAGKGFSVVADEIRKLANQVMISSKSINELIRSIENSAQGAMDSSEAISAKIDAQMKVIGNTVKSCSDIIVEVDKITLQINNVSAYLKDINTEKEDVVKSVKDISGMSLRVSAAAQQISCSIQEQSANMLELSMLAQSLNNMADVLKHEVNDFII